MEKFSLLLTLNEKKFRKIWLLANVVTLAFFPAVTLFSLISYVVKLWPTVSTSYILIGLGIFFFTTGIDVLFFWILWRLSYRGFGTKYLLLTSLFTIIAAIFPIMKLFDSSTLNKTLIESLIFFFVYSAISILHIKMYLINRSIRKRALQTA